MDITTADGVVISANVYEPAVDVVGAVLIVPAMGVPQRFYEGFARWLNGEGFRVMTFDYRGMGLSRRGPLRDVDADIFVWSERDVGAAADALASMSSGVPLTWIGHSLGGQIVPFVPGRERFAKIITVAAGSGFWKQNAPALKKKVWFFWYGAVPVATPLFGYFPGARLGMVGDLPRGVVEQWRRWCLDPEYVVGVEDGARARYADVVTPLTSFSFSDDDMMSADNINSLHGFYSGAPRSMRRFAPGDLGVKKVGHFGFFRKEMEAPIWKAHVAAELARA